MLDAMPSSLFGEWIAYEALEPFGALAEDVRHGVRTAVVANANRDPRRGSAFKPEDFMLSDTQRPAQRVSWKRVKTWAMLHNAGAQHGG